jgi:sugar phosphate isomerase/epimerase
MGMNRREWLLATTAGLGAPSIAAIVGRDSSPGLGIVIHSYMVRVAADRAKAAEKRIDNPWVFLEHAKTLGAAGVQVGIGIRPESEANQLRDQVSALGMYMEGTIRLPRDDSDLDRFERELTTARQAGVEIVRTVMMEGRRYETFHDAATFRRSGEQAVHRLELAVPVAQRVKIRLAVENHKDWRVDELLTILKRLNSDYLGVCLDTGNSVALLEDPVHVVEALAPWAITTHFKDMDLEEQRDGFGLAEVPLGRGYLDLKRIVDALRAARPSIRFNLEMITRDPLSVPCLKDDYWSTFAAVPGKDLAQSLRHVRDRAQRRDHPLPRITNLPKDEQIRIEEANVRESLEWARKGLVS